MRKKAEEEKKRKEEEAKRTLEEQDRKKDELAKKAYEKKLKEWEEINAARKFAIQQLEEKIEKQAQQQERLCEEKLEMEQTRIENEKYRIGERMVEVQREISSSQVELKKLGLFKIGEKNRLKEKIRNLQNEYADLRDAHAAKDVEYAKRCDELTVEANRAREVFYTQPEAMKYLVYTTIKKSGNSMSYDEVISELSRFDSSEIKEKCFETIQELVNRNILDVGTKLRNGLHKEKCYFVATEKAKPVLILPSVARKEAERKKKEEEERKRREEEAERKRIEIEKEKAKKKRELEKEAVYSAIFYDTTVQDVARELGIDDTMKVASYMKELLTEGRIERTVRNGKSYFSCKL